MLVVVVTWLANEGEEEKTIQLFRELSECLPKGAGLPHVCSASRS